MIYLTLENYIASVVVFWRQAYFQGAAQQRWSPWNHSCCHGIGATAVLKQCTVQWCCHGIGATTVLKQCTVQWYCQRIGATTVHTEHTVHSVAQTVLLSQNWCSNRAKECTVQCTLCCCHRFGASSFFPLGRSRCRGGCPALGFPSVLVQIIHPMDSKIKPEMTDVTYQLHVKDYLLCIFTKSSEQW